MFAKNAGPEVWPEIARQREPSVSRRQSEKRTDQRTGRRPESKTYNRTPKALSGDSRRPSASIISAPIGQPVEVSGLQSRSQASDCAEIILAPKKSASGSPTCSLWASKLAQAVKASHPWARRGKALHLLLPSLEHEWSWMRC